MHIPYNQKEPIGKNSPFSVLHGVKGVKVESSFSHKGFAACNRKGVFLFNQHDYFRCQSRLFLLDFFLLRKVFPTEEYINHNLLSYCYKNKLKYEVLVVLVDFTCI